MREPDIERDGWCLESGEAYDAAAPDTFPIPTVKERLNLQIGDFAKLIFRIHVEDVDDPFPAERMWVIVSDIRQDGYTGILDNDPDAVAENDLFWSGIELPFEACHVIQIMPGDENSKAIVADGPKRRWPRD